MSPPRNPRITGILLLVLAAGTVGGLLALDHVLEEDAPSGSVEAHAVVAGRNGTHVFNGTVTAGNATVLGVLDAASHAGAFPYRTEEHSLGTQVVSINGTGNEGASGWTYRVLHDGTWCWGDRASDEYPVRGGDTVVWQWSDGPPGGGCWSAS